MPVLEIVLTLLAAAACGALLHTRSAHARLARDLRQLVADLDDERVRSAAAARDANGRLNAVLAAATEYSIVGTDLHRTITIFNTGAERMLGWTADEVVGRATPALFHDLDELGDDGRLVGFVGIASDVTKRRAVER